MHARGPDVGAHHFLTFVLCVRCEGKGIGRDDQAPQFAQENSKHCNRQALVLRVIQEVDRAVGSSSWYLEATCYQAHTLTTAKDSGMLSVSILHDAVLSTFDPTYKIETEISQGVCSYYKGLPE